MGILQQILLTIWSLPGKFQIPENQWIRISEIIIPESSEAYSLLNVVAGLALAALTESYMVLSKAMTRGEIPA